MIEIKEPEEEECKLKRIHRQVKNNAKLNNVDVEWHMHRKEMVVCIEYDFGVLLKSRFQRWLHFYFPYSVKFWAKLDAETYVMTIGNVEEHLFDRIYAASKLLFNDIEGLTVVIEKDYC
jgi:hypothetical protein